MKWLALLSNLGLDQLEVEETGVPVVISDLRRERRLVTQPPLVWNLSSQIHVGNEVDVLELERRPVAVLGPLSPGPTKMSNRVS